MKTMNCKQLAGACDQEFKANSFDEIVEMSKKHGMEMLQKGDNAHQEAMSKMQQMMKSPNEMKVWFENKRKEFDDLPNF